MSDSTVLTVPQELVEFLRSYNSFIIAGHKEPDGDCIGSQVALASALQRLNKNTYLVNPGPFDRQEIADQESLFSQTIPTTVDPAPDAVVVLDCSSADRIGSIADEIDGLPLAVVDHHAAGDRFGDVLFIRPEIPSTTMLVQAIFKELGLEPTEAEAQVLFLGLVTDTGFFRFLAPEQYTAYTAAADLLQAGASPRVTDQVISSGRTLESRLLIARQLQRVETIRDGEILLTFQTRADEKEFGKRRDSDALYRLLLAVDGVRVIAVAKEKEQGTAVSFRATDQTDVGTFAGRFGGGGHQKAAGAFVEEDLQTFLPRLRAALSEIP